MEQEGRNLSLYQNNENDRHRSRNPKEHVAFTSRNKEEPPNDKSELFKIKRTSISGSLRKKLKEQANHHLSSVNPTIPLELNYFEEGRRVYKEGKFTEALKLFELAIEKTPESAESHYYAALCYLNKHLYQRAYDLLETLLEKFVAFQKKTVYLFAAIAAKHLSRTSRAIIILGQGIQKYPDYLDLYIYRAKLYDQENEVEMAHQDY